MKKSKKKSSKKDRNPSRDPLVGDLSDVLLTADWKFAKFELTKPKTETITLRLSKELLSGLKTEAMKEGIEYQKLLRILMENYLRKKADWHYK